MPSFETPALPRRFASMLYEALLLLGVVGVLVVFPQSIYAMNAGQAAAPWLTQLHLLIVLAAYFTWFWHRGQTLAMKTWKIRLVCAGSGAVASLPRALLRYALCWPSLGLFGAGLLWALIDRDGQFLHDRIAGTRLVATN